MNPQAVRTSGDGIENPEKSSLETTFKRTQKTSSTSSENADKIDKLGKDYLSKQFQSSASHHQIFYNPTTSEDCHINYPPPVQPKGKRFYLIPKLVTPKSSLQSLKNKKLNLILMEPYRACVQPIIPYAKNENKVKISRNNLDLNELVKHLSLNEGLRPQDLASGDKFLEIKKERDFFENQLNFQMQVNTELKGLLVHCLGEDLQTKVNNLTEDKMKIAKSLSTNTEQIEFLSSQSEVWRSKFLASSLMVEELAKVKTTLAQRNNALVASNKQLLSTLERIRFDLVETFQNLKFLSGVQETNLKSLNVNDLTSECLNIIQQIVLNSGKIGLPGNSNFDHLETLTDAEKIAMKTLTESTNSHAIDEAFQAVCSQAQNEYRRERSRTEDEFEIVEKNE